MPRVTSGGIVSSADEPDEPTVQLASGETVEVQTPGEPDQHGPTDDATSSEEEPSAGNSSSRSETTSAPTKSANKRSGSGR